MQKDRIQHVEDYVKRAMPGEVAHDFKHADRVRRWALRIARAEGFENLEIVEAAALLHDIGLPFAEQRSKHGQVGAKVAAKFLRANGLFVQQEVEEIANAIRYHNTKVGDGRLLEILKDADMLDMFGAVGTMRAFTSQASKPEYDPRNVRGSTWEMSNEDFDQRFAEGVGIGDFIVDQLNFQISCYGNLSTETARRLARPLVEFMKAFVVQLESEINGGGL